MKTAYLTTLTARFNPFSTTGKVPRLFLSLLPASAQRSIKITTTQLPRSSTLPALLELGFKDGKTLKFSWGDEEARAEATAKERGVPKPKRIEKVQLQDIVAEVDRHARILGRKEDLNS